MNFRAVFIWADSRVVLSWISNHKILPAFIRRRIDKIRAVEDVKFRYVPGEINPADIPSRGMLLNELDYRRLEQQDC